MVPTNTVQEFQQMKNKKKTLLNEQNQFQVVDFYNDQHLKGQEFKIKTIQGDFLNPKNMKLLDQENKFICQEREDNVAYLGDFTKQKVIAEFKPEHQNQSQKINDLTPWIGKQAHFQPSDEFMTVGDKQITRFDPRQQKQVSDRFYKSFK